MTSERSIRWCAGHGVNCFTIPEPTSRLKRNVEIYYEELDKQGWPDRLNRGPFKYGWDADRKRGFAFCRNIHLVMPGVDRDQAWQRVKLAMELERDYYGPFGFAAVLAEADEPGTGCLGRPARLAPGCGQVITLQDSCEPTFGPRLFRTSVVKKTRVGLRAGTDVGAVALLGGSIVNAQAAPGIINACKDNRSGVLSAVPNQLITTTTCPAGTTVLTWNLQGPKGDPGPVGAAGSHRRPRFERQRAMADVLELAPLDLAWPRWQAWCSPLQGLDAGHLIGAEHALPDHDTTRRLPVHAAHVGDPLSAFLGWLVGGGRQPIPDQVRFEIGRF